MTTDTCWLHRPNIADPGSHVLVLPRACTHASSRHLGLAPLPEVIIALQSPRQARNLVMTRSSAWYRCNVHASCNTINVVGRTLNMPGHDHDPLSHLLRSPKRFIAQIRSDMTPLPAHHARPRLPCPRIREHRLCVHRGQPGVQLALVPRSSACARSTSDPAQPQAMGVLRRPAFVPLWRRFR